jgi:hypothetical protein
LGSSQYEDYFDPKISEKNKKKKSRERVVAFKIFKNHKFSVCGAELRCERGFSGPKAAVKVLKSEILIYHPFF